MMYQGFKSPDFEDKSLLDKTFCFLFKLMEYRNQLIINHWQTTSYAEHKWTDKLADKLDEFTDLLGEAVIGTMGRPQIQSKSLEICDINLCSSKTILDKLCDETREILEEYKVTDFSGIIAPLEELETVIKKYKYLSTLE